MWAGRLLTLPALWLTPALARPLISLSASLPGVAQVEGAWSASIVSLSPLAHSLLPRPCWWERAGPRGPGKVLLLNPLSLGSEQLLKKEWFSFCGLKVSCGKGGFADKAIAPWQSV